MKEIQKNLHIIGSWDCILNMLWVIDLFFILLYSSCGDSVLKEPKYTAVFLSINNLNPVSSFTFFVIGMYYIHSIFYSRLIISWKNINKPRLSLKSLVMSTLFKVCNRTEKFYLYDSCYYILSLLLWLFFTEVSSLTVIIKEISLVVLFFL